MITSLEIENFKSWKSTGQIRLAPITAFFGSNSAGKTSLLQFLLMLKQTTESPDRKQVLHLGDPRSIVDLGTFPDILHRRVLDHPLTWRITWRLPQPLRIPDSGRGDVLSEEDTLSFSASIVWRYKKDNGDQTSSPDMTGGRAIVKEMGYQSGKRFFGMRLKHASDSEEEYEVYSSPAGFTFHRSRGRPSRLYGPVKCYSFPSEVRGYKNADFLKDFELAFEKMCQQMLYLGPLREYPHRQYTWAGQRPTDVGPRGERAIDALLASRDDDMGTAHGRNKKRLPLEGQVAHWLKDLGLIASFAVRPITAHSNLYQVWVRHSSGSPEVLITDVGFGVSQVLPVISLCYYAPVGATLILEQPEIHLHPGVQAGLADVLVDAVKTRSIQIILESHSEHLLRRLQRRIAEEASGLTHQDVALYFCTTDEQGTSQLQPLEIDPYGHITNWPKDFFGDEMADLLAMTQAMMKRQREEEENELHRD